MDPTTVQVRDTMTRFCYFLYFNIVYSKQTGQKLPSKFRRPCIFFILEFNQSSCPRKILAISKLFSQDFNRNEESQILITNFNFNFKKPPNIYSDWKIILHRWITSNHVQGVRAYSASLICTTGRCRPNLYLKTWQQWRWTLLVLYEAKSNIFILPPMHSSTHLNLA